MSTLADLVLQAVPLSFQTSQEVGKQLEIVTNTLIQKMVHHHYVISDDVMRVPATCMTSFIKCICQTGNIGIADLSAKERDLKS